MIKFSFAFKEKMKHTIKWQKWTAIIICWKYLHAPSDIYVVTTY